MGEAKAKGGRYVVLNERFATVIDKKHNRKCRIKIEEVEGYTQERKFYGVAMFPVKVPFEIKRFMRKPKTEYAMENREMWFPIAGAKSTREAAALLTTAMTDFAKKVEASNDQQD